MEMEELLNAWKTYDAKLDHSLSLNRAMLREMKVDKTRSRMQRTLVARGVEAGIFSLLTIALCVFAVNRLPYPEFVLAAGVLLVFYILGFAGSIKQIVMISQIDYAGSVVDIQRKIEQITAHHLQLIRLSMLSLPFYTAYIVIGFELFFGVNIFKQGNHDWWVGQLIFSAFMIPLALWLYRKIRPDNIHLKWVKNLTTSLGGSSLTKAVQFLHDIEKFEK